MIKTCDLCKHAPYNWRNYSQLPTCAHPDVFYENVFAKEGGIWQLYAANTGGHCGTQLVKFEIMELCDE